MRRALLRKEIHFAGPAAGAPGPRSRRADRGQRLAGARRAAPGAVTSLSQFGRRLTPISALVNAGAVQKSVGKVGKVDKVEIGCSRSPSTGYQVPMRIRCCFFDWCMESGAIPDSRFLAWALPSPSGPRGATQHIGRPGQQALAPALQALAPRPEHRGHNCHVPAPPRRQAAHRRRVARHGSPFRCYRRNTARSLAFAGRWGKGHFVYMHSLNPTHTQREP